MKNLIEIIIKDNNKIVCHIYDEYGNVHYEVYQNYLNYMYKILRNYKDIKICNNEIYYNDDKYKVKISAFSYTDNKDINELIDKIETLYIKEKKNKLRKKRIKRISAFSGAVIISIGALVNSLGDKNIINDNNISYLNNVDDNENDIDNVIDLSLDNINTYDLEYEDRTDSNKYINTKNKYGNIINELSLEYGIDPRIMLAIATQESGEHIINDNLPAIGLMQIEKSVWNNQNLSAYNYKTDSVENVHITIDKLKDINFNIKVACMIFQKCLKDTNYNIPVAIQMYNYGYGNIIKTMKLYYGDNIDYNEIINDKNNSWLDARNQIKVGDKNYLEHVLSYIEDDNNLSFKNNNVLVSCSFNREYSKKI